MKQLSNTLNPESLVRAGVKLLICAATLEEAPACRLLLQANSTFRCAAEVFR